MAAGRREFLTDEAVEAEIARLQQSPLVALARKEERIRNRRRQYMYALRQYEKKGKQLQADGITMEMLEALGAATGPEYLQREGEDNAGTAANDSAY